ncbi:MAG: hypothetical protein K2L85_04280 [Paramuribaculum sp.]|nr:hypothetical protein [Paramuribaculum sp.]
MHRFLATTILCLAAICSTFSAASVTSEPENITGWNHFVWGAEVGGAIDMTSNGLSTINADAYFGYKNAWIDAVGLGASVNMMVNNSVRTYPVYALLRTDFSSRRGLVFMDLRGGIAINNLTYSNSQTSLYLSPGVGFNLARGRSFCSYLTISYIYNGLKPFDLGDRRCDVDGLSMACIRLGIRF